MSSPTLLPILSLAMFIPYMAPAKVPAIFILGDSTVDVGTNTYLPGSAVRADFDYNGIDYPFSRSTGRFSNGFNSADFLAKLMGFRKSPPPFLFLLNATSDLPKHVLRGVNFASGGSGLLDVTGQALKVVPMSQQLKQFATVRSKIAAMKGAAETEKLLSKSMFCISVGSNDIFGYFSTVGTIPKQQFISTLISAYKDHIKSLFNLGARKFGIISVPPIGCCPYLRLSNAGNCLDAVNDLAMTFYSALETLFSNLSTELQGMKYSLGNTYQMIMDVIENPLPYDIKYVKSACCGAGTLNAEDACTPEANLCPDRSDYLFWDPFHPTRAASMIAALNLYHGDPRYVAPINFSQLVEIY